MKKLIAAAITLLSASAATAGTVIFTAPEVMNIEEPARMGGSGAWLIPVIIGAVLFLALKPRGDTPTNGQTNGQQNGQLTR